MMWFSNVNQCWKKYHQLIPAEMEFAGFPESDFRNATLLFSMLEVWSPVKKKVKESLGLSPDGRGSASPLSFQKVFVLPSIQAEVMLCQRKTPTLFLSLRGKHLPNAPSVSPLLVCGLRDMCTPFPVWDIETNAKTLFTTSPLLPARISSVFSSKQKQSRRCIALFLCTKASNLNPRCLFLN